MNIHLLRLEMNFIANQIRAYLRYFVANIVNNLSFKNELVILFVFCRKCCIFLCIIESW